MRKSEAAVAAIILVSFIIGAYLYPRMPEKVASHWNMAGEVDGRMPKFWGTFLMPILLALLSVFFIIIPVIDPLKSNIQKFRDYYDMFVVVFSLFLLYIYLLTLIWNFGLEFNMVQLLAPAFGILLYCAGVLTQNAKRNWFIGIQTPWTLSSDRVWSKTHKRGGVLLKATAVISLLGVFLPSYAAFFILIPVIVVMVYIITYSYVEYQREKKR